jgi:hypothetical protein
MRKRKHRRTTNAKANFDSRGLLRDGGSYRSRSSILDLKMIRKFGKHRTRTAFGKLVDLINHQQFEGATNA